MSYEYDHFLVEHKTNVAAGYEWILTYLPHLISDAAKLEAQICYEHDASKTQDDEYEAYDTYFYGNNTTAKVKNNFKTAVLNHLHRNPHHWQHWVLTPDNSGKPEFLVEMPYNYILEMICDWWAFSWAKENLYEIFTWYEERKDYIKISEATRKTVEYILSAIKDELERQEVNK